MNRKMFELTDRQLSKCTEVSLPSDEWFMGEWKRLHHRKLAGWGMGKRQWIISMMSRTADYQRGLGQGRVDAASGLEYSEERIDSAYNLGYYRGYMNYESDRRGWDDRTRQRFDDQYVNEAVTA